MDREVRDFATWSANHSASGRYFSRRYGSRCFAMTVRWSRLRAPSSARWCLRIASRSRPRYGLPFPLLFSYSPLIVGSRRARGRRGRARADGSAARDRAAVGELPVRRSVGGVRARVFGGAPGGGLPVPAFREVRRMPVGGAPD